MVDSYSITAKPWTDEEIDILKQYYPTHGKLFCCTLLGRPEGSIRQKSARLGLRQDITSAFFAEWQARAAQAHIGTKRPAQAEVMRALHRQGKLLKTPQQKKTIGERMRRHFQIHGHPRGYLGHKHSEEALKKIAMASLRNWNDPTTPGYQRLRNEIAQQRRSDALRARLNAGEEVLRRGYSRGRQGKRADLGIYVRSAWEANFCRYLIWLQSRGDIYKWEYETDTFVFEAIKRGTRSYMPDFKIWETAESTPYYVEVKGWLDQKGKTKLERMAKYFPHIRVDLFDKTQYRDLENKLGRVIPGWE
jgi:hypothetical protein